MDVLRRQFRYLDRFPIDDSEFAPLVRCLIDGVEAGLRNVGVPEGTADEARQRILEEASAMYTSWCAQNDPDGADADEDAEVFEYLMVHGRWPNRRVRR